MYATFTLRRSSQSACRIVILGIVLVLVGQLWPAPAHATQLVNFKLTGTMHGRHAGSTTLLADGKVLVASVWTPSSPDLPEIYDPESQTWSTTTSMITPRYGNSAVLLTNKQVLVAGGFTLQSVLTANAELYNPATGTWRATSSMLEPCSTSNALLLSNNKVLVLCENGRLYAQLYDPTTEQWTATGPMATPSRGGSFSLTVLLNGKVLLAGGVANIPSGWQSTAELYDPTTNKWTATGNMLTARGEHSATLLPDGTVLIAGGVGSDITYLKSAEIYHPDTGTWTAARDLPYPRFVQTATRLNNGQVLLVGGSGVVNYKFVDVTTTQVYDPPTDTWSDAGSLVARRMYNMTTLLKDGSVLVVGGSTDQGFVTEVERSNRILPDAAGPSGRIAINGIARATTSRDVTLIVSATYLSSDIGDMSFSNDGSTWGNWRPYTTSTLWTLSSGTGTKTVYARFRDAANNSSAIVSDSIELNTTASSYYGLTINNGALFTNQVSVTLSIGAPAHVAEMQISNDGGFADADWEPYTTSKAWQITRIGNTVIPRIVYVRYRDAAETVSNIVQDDIVLDLMPPTGSVRVASTTATARTTSRALLLDASDDVSGVGQMQISDRADMYGATWQPYQTTATWINTSPKVYVRFQDNAGNISTIYSNTTSVQPQMYLPLTTR